MVRRLVQHQDARFLRQGAGDHDPLALAARQGAETAVGQMDKVHPDHRGIGDRGIAGARPHALPMRQATKGDDVAGGQGKVGRLFLQHRRDSAGSLPRGGQPEIAAFHDDRPGKGRLMPIQQAKQRGFARPVRAADRQHLACGQTEGNVMQDRGRALWPPGDVAEFKDGHWIAPSRVTIIAAGMRASVASHRLSGRSRPVIQPSSRAA